MAIKTPLPQTQIQIHAKNKEAHPGAALVPVPHQSLAKMQQECVAKAQAKVAQQVQKQQHIQHTTEFKHTDMANKDIINATPHPSFTPKPWPPPRNSKKANLTPVAEVSDESSDEELFKAPCFEESATKEESTVEGNPPPPAKKLKAKTAVGAKTTRKVITKVSDAPAIPKK